MPFNPVSYQYWAEPVRFSIFHSLSPGPSKPNSHAAAAVFGSSVVCQARNSRVPAFASGAL